MGEVLEKARRLDWIAKTGFVARGLLYMMFGWVALSLRQRADEGQSAVFDILGKLPLGQLFLAATALGLFAYGLFRLVCAWLDIEAKGSDPKGWAGRTAQAFSGLVHLALAWSATAFLIGWKKTYDHAGDANNRQAARTLLDLPLGNAALYLIAAGLVFAGLLQFRKAWKASHMKQCRADTPQIACTIGRIGLATRGVVFGIVAWSFLRAAQTDSAGEVKSLGSAVLSLRQHDALYLATCVGIILFGVFSLMLARYRIVPQVDVVDAAKHKLEEARA